MSISEAARQMKVSRQYANRVEHKALAKIRRAIEADPEFAQLVEDVFDGEEAN